MENKKYVGIPVDMHNRDNWVGIIGSRKANSQELQAAYDFAKRCVKKGKVVVSGLAAGIDAAAHEGAIAGGGTTLAIVNTTSSQLIYPKENQDLAEKIRLYGGILHPYLMNAQNNQEKGMSQFQKRLIERDALLGFLVSTLVVVKDSPEPVDGGTRWALNYGDKFEKKIFRLDNEGNLHQNPLYKKSSIYWEPELKIKGLFI